MARLVIHGFDRSYENVYRFHSNVVGKHDFVGTFAVLIIVGLVCRGFGSPKLTWTEKWKPVISSSNIQWLNRRSLDLLPASRLVAKARVGLMFI